MSLLAFVLRAALALSPSHDHQALAQAIAHQVDSEPPLFAGDDDKTKTAALYVAIAYRESSLRNDVTGDGGRSHCAYQIWIDPGQRTAEGWTPEELRRDPAKCVAVAARKLRESFRACKAYPVSIYAGGPQGCALTRARRVSNDRLWLAKRLQTEAGQ